MKTKKRVLTGIFCILMALMCVLSIVACGGDETPEEEKECTHEWGEWEETTPATCTEDGVETRKCTLDPEHTETRKIAAKGHSYGEYISDENASCTADGTKTAICADCEKTDTVIDEGSALAHDYSVCAVNDKYLKSAAGCTEKAVYYKTCACGAVSEEDTFEYGSVVHSYSTELSKDATHHWYECTVCEDKTSVKAHNWDDGKVTKPATKTQEGKKLFTCSDCGQTKETTIPKIGHVHSAVKTSAVRATCEKDGNIEYWYCASCDKYFTDADLTKEVFKENLIIDAFNHKNTMVDFVLNPGCETPGYTTYKCADCDYTYDVEIPATGHGWEVKGVIEADCKTIGHTLHECSSCHEQKKTDLVPKTACAETSEITKVASCTENGIRTYTCSVCESTRTETIAKIGHDYDAVVTAPTCTKDGYTTHTCKNGCGSSYTDSVVKTEGHNWVEDEENSCAATCTVPGEEISCCSECDEVKTVIIPASGHTMVPETCTEDGYCSECNAPGKPAHGHNYTVVLDDVAATCSENGYIRYACSYGCNSTTETTPDDHKAHGHNLAAIEWSTSLVLVDAHSCLYANERSGVCPDCEETVKNTSEPFEKHTYVAKITTAATCCEEGTKTYTCKECNDSYDENYAVVEDAHKWDAGVLQADAVTTVYTCEHNSAHTKKSVSAKQNTSTSINSEAIKDSDDVELKNATFVPSKEIKDSISANEDVKLSADILENEAFENAMSQLSEEDQKRLKNGNIFNFTIEVGNRQLSDLGGTMTVRIPYTLDKENGEDPEDVVIAYINGDKIELKKATYIEIGDQGYAVFDTEHFSYYTVTKLTPAERCAIYGHSYSDPKVVPATCLTGGYTVEVCLRCGDKQVYNVVEALGHDFVLNDETYVEHTCTVEGREDYACSRCQVGYKVITPANGHNWNIDIEHTYPATCTSAGANAYKCDACHSSYTEEIASLGHDFHEIYKKRANCIEGGYTDIQCSTCFIEVRTDFVKPTEHKVIDVVVTPTCVEGGYTAHYCNVCHQSFANTDETPVAAHSWNIREADCVNDKVCVVCNTRGEKAHGHSMTKDGVCEHCGTPCEHEYVLKGTIEATCVSHGYDVYVCNVCLNTRYDNYKDYADHDYEFVETVAPTCTKDGYDLYACSHCKTKIYRNYTDKLEHTYVFSHNIGATCTSPGYKVEECSSCGKTKKTETSPAVSHTFENGECTVCGISSDLFYLSMLNAWSGVKGAAIKLHNLSVIAENLDTGFDDGSRWVVSENLSLIEIPEIMIYLDENGKLCGAAHGSISIVNGVGIPATVYSIKAVIEGDNIYIEMCETTEGNSKYNYVRATLGYLMSEIVSDTDGFGAAMDWATEYLIPILSGINGESAEFIDNFVGSLIDMLFSQEATANGTVYTLDFAKLYALNDNVAQLSISELVDTYFGEGFYEKLTADVDELLKVNVSDILDYLNGAGIPKDKVVAAIDALLLIAMEEDVSIEDMLKSPELEGVTVEEMLCMMFEMDEIDIVAIMDNFASVNIYQEMGSVSQAKAAIGSIIEMIEKSIGLSFTVNAEGKTTEINIEIKDLVVMQSDSYRITLSVGLNASIDGRIEVSWSDIADKIDGMIPEDVFVFDDEVEYEDPVIIGNGGGGGGPDYEDEVCKDHYDDNLDNKCDKCGAEIYSTDICLHEDNDSDGTCDYCGIPLKEYNPNVCDHHDKDGDNYCDKCGMQLVEYRPTACDHHDKNGDKKCDKCGALVDGKIVYNEVKYTSFESVDGFVEYKGESYMSMSVFYEQARCIYALSEIIGVQITPDCGDWAAYSLAFKTTYDMVSLEMIYLVDPDSGDTVYIIIYNKAADAYIEFTLDYENGAMIALFPDGSTVSFDPEMDFGELGRYYPEDWWENYRTSSISENIYYNSVSGEIDFDTHHNYELVEEESFEPEHCGDIGREYYVCSECSDVHSYTYEKAHSYKWTYVLNENSSTCEDGLDYICICTDCGLIEEREFNVYYGHYLEENITYENGAVYRAYSCESCGLDMGGKEKLYTVVADDSFIFDENAAEYDDMGVFTFVPTESGIYELYSNGNIYAYINVPNTDFYVSGSLYEGIEAYLEAGTTYRIVVSYYGSWGNVELRFNARTEEVIDLSQYGCECGGRLIVTSHFYNAEVSIESDCAFRHTGIDSAICTECGFGYYTESGTDIDEYCNQIAYGAYHFGKYNEEQTEEFVYIIYSYKTGEVCHTTEYRGDRNQYEIIDENGNTVTVYYEEHESFCTNCNNTVYKNRTENAYNSSDVRIWSKEFIYEWSAENAELFLYRTVYIEYVLISNGNNINEKESLREERYYDENGEESEWSIQESFYYGCTKEVHYSTSYGEDSVKTFTEHINVSRDDKDEYEFTDEYGNKRTARVEIYENACSRCGTVSSKTVNTYHYDEYGNVVYEHYEKYYRSEETGRLQLNEDRVVNYGIAYGLYGKPFSYRLSAIDTFYYGSDDDYYSQVWTYEYNGNYCEASVYHNGEYYREEDCHNYESMFVLHSGASDCTEGVDYVTVCTRCERVDYRHEYYSYEHIHCFEYSVIDGVIYRRTYCTCCGAVIEENGEYSSIVTDEELTVTDKHSDGYLAFEFVPTVSGRYQFYSEGRGRDPMGYIIDATGYYISSNDDGLEYNNFAVAADLVAGETYYLRISRDFYNHTIFFAKVDSVEVDLSAYGCSCGGRLVIYHQFGGKCPELVADCEFSYTGEYYSCERCGFSYYESHDYKYDDFCNEVAVHSFFFKLRGEKDFVQYVIDERKTGYNCHSNSWESINEVENITDDSGNVIKTIETNGEKYVCENCHAVTYINKYINTCDSDGDVTESRTETYHYSSDLNGIYLAEEYIHRWEKVVTDYGFINREVYYSYAYYDDDGSKYSSYTVVTVHGDGGSCRVDRFVNDNGYEYVETEYNHNTDWKRVEEECSEEWIIDENGNRVRVVTVSEERYCTKCYGSFEKIVYINVFDEDGFAIRYIEERYDPYAISETDYGYRIRSTSVTEYGVYGVVRGEYKTYVLRHTFCNYDENGELVERNERVYDYRYGNYCHYMMTETNIYGDIIEEREGSEHIRILNAKRLCEGSHNCDDGIECYDYCVACDFVNVYDYDTGHMSTERDPEIIYTSDFGAYCGGYIEVYYCPCGERAFVYTDNIGCDLHCSCEWYEDEEGKEDHYKDTYTCAVTDPEKCPFAFTFETWRGYDNMCRPTVYYVYTFGVGTDNPYVISYSVSGSTSHHNLWDKNIYSESDVIDGVPADISYNECRCVRCGYLESTRYIVSFSDEDGHCVSRVVTTETFVNGTLYSEEIMKYVYPYAEYNAGDYRYSNEFVVSREYNVYDESGNITYWSTSEYDYSEGYCKPNVTNRDSDGYEWSGSEGHHRDEYYVTINPSTCTQHGSQMSICHWCGEEFEITQYPHNHAYQWDYENAMYVCVYCGLNNEKGVDGNVILEDLTEEYGYGEYLVMGYLFRDCFDYIVAVSIVVDGIEEPIILENVFGYDDNSSIVRVNIGEVASAIAEMGYSIYDVNVRVSIVPFGGDSEFDYAITFDTVAAE